MFPQIYNNYMVGHNLKQVMKYFLMYILPRYLLIVNVNLFSRISDCIIIMFLGFSRTGLFAWPALLSFYSKPCLFFYK